MTGCRGAKPGEATTTSGAKSASSSGTRRERPVHEPRADHGQQALVLLVGLLGDDEHVGAELGERVGDGEAGDRQPEHRDAQALPVRVPAREGVQPRSTLMCCASHST